jgi:hypothetical protein
VLGGRFTDLLNLRMLFVHDPLLSGLVLPGIVASDTQAAHLQSYLDELCYRLKRRDQRLDQRLDLLRRILKRCALHTPPATYSELIAA